MSRAPSETDLGESALTIALASYTAVGGFRATLLSDFAHTGLIMAILFAFMFCTFATNPGTSLFLLSPKLADGRSCSDLGSPSKVYDLLTVAAQNYPLTGNAQGSYMTFRSTDGLVFVSSALACAGRSAHLLAITGSHRHH